MRRFQLAFTSSDNNHGMQVVTLGPGADSRHPTRLELVAGALLLGTVILHVAAMFPTYFSGAGSHSSVASQPDQAALYAVLAAAWVLALGVGLTGPARMPLCAGLAAGVAATELGFRVSDVGDAIRFGSSQAGAGLWLMAVAWLVGAAGAGAAGAAASERGGRAVRGSGDVALRRSGNSQVGPYDQAIDVAPEGPLHAPPEIALEATTQTVAEGVSEPEPEAAVDATDGMAEVATIAASTAALSPAATAADPVAIPSAGAPPEKSIGWTILLGVLGLATAGAFLPSWDHYVAVVTSSGRSLSFDLGNAFSGPWEEILGNVLVAIALAGVPIVASRWRNRAAGAAAVAGALMVLASQLVSAVVQVDQAVSPSTFGLSPAQFSQYGVRAGLKLTGWYTLDALAAFALFAAVMVWATGRVVHENSPGTLPNAPELRSEAMPLSS